VSSCRPGPRGASGIEVAGDPWPDAARLGLPADPCPGRQAGGRSAGLALLDSFLSGRGHRDPHSFPARRATDPLRRGRDAAAVHCSAAGFSVPVPPATADPLWSLSLLVAEDLLIMERGDDGYRLTAASLCSPSHWRLAEKFGRPLREIHDPVPGIHGALSPRIDRFLEHLRPAHPVQRFNWTLQADAGLFHDGRAGASAQAGAAASLYYRVERQTLLRLPRSGAVVFTIRVFLHPLETLAGRPGALAALGHAVDAAPPALARYKGFERLRAALARYPVS